MLGLTTDRLALFTLASLVLAATPGPVWLYLISRTLAQGRRAGYFSMFGVAAGLSLHATFAAFGLTVVLLAVPFAFDAIKLAGAAYLLWLAYTTVRGAGFTFTPQPLEPVRDRVLLRQAFIAAVINPKVAVFYLSLFPQFVDPAAGPVLGQSLLLGAIQVGTAALDGHRTGDSRRRSRGVVRAAAILVAAAALVSGQCLRRAGGVAGADAAAEARTRAAQCEFHRRLGRCDQLRPLDAVAGWRSRARFSTGSITTIGAFATSRSRQRRCLKMATGTRFASALASASTFTIGASRSTASIERNFDLDSLTDAERDALWQAVKQSFVALLADHRQPECAETFFNSVCTKLLHRDYFHNRFHLRAAGRGDRVHGFRSAVISQLLPGDRGAEARAAKNHHRLRIGMSLGGCRARHPARGARRGRCAPNGKSRSSDRGTSSPIFSCRFCRICFSATRVRTSSGASSTAPASRQWRCRFCATRTARCTSTPCCSPPI